MLNSNPAQVSRRQYQRYFDVLFEPEDLVEIRAIRNTASGRSQVVERCWERASELADLYDHFRGLNQKSANIYVGVNPRTHRASTKQAVAICRSIWADFDNVDHRGAEGLWQGLLPAPTMVISSGHGVHAYWRLEEPANVARGSGREAFEAMLKWLYREICADSTQDVSRLLRVPGFMNVKSDPVSCEIVRASSATVSLRDFESRFDKANRMKPKTARRAAVIDLPSTALPATDARIRKLLATLDQPATDRSRRDFAVVCQLLRYGISPQEISILVAGQSKFVNRSYTETTIRNAISSVADRHS